jgi:hypothetical protein
MWCAAKASRSWSVVQNDAGMIGAAMSLSLHTLATAVALARRDHYPDTDSAALGYLIVTWAPVSSAYAELAATVCRDGEGHAA